MADPVSVGSSVSVTFLMKFWMHSRDKRRIWIMPGLYGVTCFPTMTCHDEHAVLKRQASSHACNSWTGLGGTRIEGVFHKAGKENHGFSKSKVL